MRYKTRDRLSSTLRLLVAVFVLPLLTSIPIIAAIAYLHSQWWQAIPVMNYSTAYWGQVILTVLGAPILLMSLWIKGVIS